jgi:hypothetical protein
VSVRSDAPQKAPLWLKLTREGNKFSSYTSLDGITWQAGESVTVQMSANAFVGLAVTSHKHASVVMAKFDFVSIAPLDTMRVDQSASASMIKLDRSNTTLAAVAPRK